MVYMFELPVLVCYLWPLGMSHVGSWQCCISHVPHRM